MKPGLRGFEAEFQDLLNKYPEIGDVEMTFIVKKKKAFSPSKQVRSDVAAAISSPALESDVLIAAEMIRNGEMSL